MLPLLDSAGPGGSGTSSDLLGFIITAGASIVVAIIGGMFLRDAKKRPVEPEPTPIQDVWDENRKRGAEIAVLTNELRVVRAAYNVALDWIERALRAWLDRGALSPPELSRREFEMMEKAGEELPFTPAQPPSEA